MIFLPHIFACEVVKVARKSPMLHVFGEGPSLGTVEIFYFKNVGTVHIQSFDLTHDLLSHRRDGAVVRASTL